MAKISEEAVREFKKIYKKKYNEDLSDKEAYRLANNFLNLYKAVYFSNSREKK